jgi:hypothetical protein
VPEAALVVACNGTRSNALQAPVAQSLRLIFFAFQKAASRYCWGTSPTGCLGEQIEAVARQRLLVPVLPIAIQA